MGKRWMAVLAAMAAAVAVAVPATAGKKDAVKRSELIAALSGQEERPGPGDPNGYGAADIRIDGRNVCFRIVAREIEPATMAHIHEAPAGSPGPVVVTLFEGAPGEAGLPPRASGCVKAPRSLTKD